jgi:hypothetical protein
MLLRTPAAAFAGFPAETAAGFGAFYVYTVLFMCTPSGDGETSPLEHGESFGEPSLIDICNSDSRSTS